MSIETLQESPLAGLHDAPGQLLRRGDEASVRLEEQPLIELANLRVDPASTPARDALHAAFDLDLPATPNTVAQGRDVMALWLAPDEWLLRAGESWRGDLAGQVQAALADVELFAVTNQGSANSTLRLHGPKSRDVLNAGCPLDLHPRMFKPGQCAQSHYFKASVLLRVLDSQGNDWELIVRRSFADYTARMLLDAMDNI
ncbi:MAG: sarcosine oxidase subunit gamma [Candidimonas sp.]|nr:MAG: sarcosine oxidase subunit gamma [Candidimonas sp.]